MLLPLSAVHISTYVSSNSSAMLIHFGLTDFFKPVSLILPVTSYTYLVNLLGQSCKLLLAYVSMVSILKHLVPAAECLSHIIECILANPLSKTK